MCKASCLSAADLEALAGSVLRLHAYFQAYSWDITWQSGLVSLKIHVGTPVEMGCACLALCQLVCLQST